MALTADFDNLVIHSDASITDMVAFHLALRDIEDSEAGIIAPVIHTYKEIDLGGAVFPAIAFINGWTFQMPPGNWQLRGGNFKATINPVAGSFIDRTQSAAYAVTSVGAGGATPEDIAVAVLAILNSNSIPVDTVKMNGAPVAGDGTPGNKWRGV